MLMRIRSFTDYFEISDIERALVRDASMAYAKKANGMMHEKDYNALGTTLLFFKPKRLFEIGTYLRITSDFCLSLLPASTLVSIAYINPVGLSSNRNYN